MAFPTIPTTGNGRIVGVNQANTTATRTSPNLSGLTRNNGDLLICLIIAYGSSAASGYFSGWTSGWTEFIDAGSSTGMCVGAAYRFADGSETGTVSATQVATITGHATIILMAITGAHASIIPEASALAQGTAAAADPASLDPANWGAEDTLWIAVAGNGETSTTGSWTGTGAAPTNYGNTFAVAGSDVLNGSDGAVAFRQLNASSENVGTWTTDISNARNCALTIAVRPSGIKPIAPSITATSDVTAAVAGPRPIAPAAINATSNVTAAPPIQRRDGQTAWTGVIGGAPLGTPWAATPVGGATKDITPATINATSDVTATVSRLKPVTPAGITASSDVTAAVSRTRAIAPAGITSSSSVTAAVVAQRAITPSSISATSAVTAAVTALRAIKPASINATSAVTATITARRAITPAAISATSTITVSLTKMGTAAIVPATINATSTVSASITARRAITASISSSSTVTASIVRRIRLGIAAITSTSNLSVTVGRRYALVLSPITSTSTITAAVTGGPLFVILKQFDPAEPNAPEFGGADEPGASAFGGSPDARTFDSPSPRRS